MKQYFVDRFADMLYYMDVNEINSHMSEMIPYIKEHEEIDFKTYNKYLQEIPGYNVINILKANQELFEKIHNHFLAKYKAHFYAATLR